MTQLVGVRQQAIAAGNNAIYDITNSSMVLFKKVCSDIVKCLQVIPEESILYGVYEKAIGKQNMGVLNTFRVSLYVQLWCAGLLKRCLMMRSIFLEQNIQASLAQKELDLEDAIAMCVN